MHANLQKEFACNKLQVSQILRVLMNFRLARIFTRQSYKKNPAQESFLNVTIRLETVARAWKDWWII